MAGGRYSSYAVATFVVAVVLACCCVASLVEAQMIPPGRVEVFPYTPAANPRAIVVSGRARFTVLTDRVIRIEWSRNGTFEDR